MTIMPNDHQATVLIKLIKPIKPIMTIMTIKSIMPMKPIMPSKPTMPIPLNQKKAATHFAKCCRFRSRCKRGDQLLAPQF